MDKVALVKVLNNNRFEPWPYDRRPSTNQATLFCWHQPGLPKAVFVVVVVIVVVVVVGVVVVVVVLALVLLLLLLLLLVVVVVVLITVVAVALGFGGAGLEYSRAPESIKDLKRIPPIWHLVMLKGDIRWTLSIKFKQAVPRFWVIFHPWPLFWVLWSRRHASHESRHLCLLGFNCFEFMDFNWLH